jgi:hypothetical protein
MHNLKVGNEISIKTKDGSTHSGILMKLDHQYLSAIANWGIVLTIPLNIIISITKN